MPLTPAQWNEYPVDWPFLSWNIVVRRAGGRCECAGECARNPEHLEDDGRCRNRHGQPRWRGKPWQRPVILSAAHLEHDPTSVDGLLALCEACHLHLDLGQHLASRRASREAESQTALFELV